MTWYLLHRSAYHFLAFSESTYHLPDVIRLSLWRAKIFPVYISNHGSESWSSGLLAILLSELSFSFL
jgi:hypothetical protein